MTNIIETTATLSAPSLKEDEYLNEFDGLVYCSKCHTARQTRKALAGRTFTPYILCDCQRELFEKEKAEREHEEFLRTISQMKSSGLQDKALYDYNFSNDNGINPEIKHAHTYVEKWSEMKQNSTGLLLWGDVGTGKSFFAGCIANALLEQGVPVLMTNFAKILNTLTGMFSEDRNQFINSLNQYSLLIVDDLGIERNSEFALEQVFNVIDSRYRSKKPMIITTNLTLSELNNPPDLMRKRIYDRILENCIPLKINNQNIRELNASSNMTRAKQLFT
ncbi:ATP-binding protein [Mediterraneibacter gnavus]|uniref:ATP-binding protein n=1 Tax=Mediterraneibacter gnavus TaxID=33038 RepID=UPI00356A4139